MKHFHTKKYDFILQHNIACYIKIKYIGSPKQSICLFFFFSNSDTKNYLFSSQDKHLLHLLNSFLPPKLSFNFLTALSLLKTAEIQNKNKANKQKSP